MAKFELDLGDEFKLDAEEAFNFWVETQTPLAQTEEQKKALELITIDKWIVSILSKPVYDFIRQKRTFGA